MAQPFFKTPFLHNYMDLTSVDFQVNTCYALIESLTKKSTETLKHKEVIPIAEEKQRHGNARRVRLQKS